MFCCDIIVFDDRQVIKYTEAIDLKNYNNQQLPKGDNVYITQIGYDLLIASRKVFFRYDTEQDILLQDYHLEQILDGHCSYSYIKEDSLGTSGMLPMEFKNATISNSIQNILFGMTQC